VRELPVYESVLDTFVGAVLSSVAFDGEIYTIQFEGMDILQGWYEPNDGMTDRSHFELEFPWI